jgi:predicted RNase H-like HicB family nuclease
MATPAPNVPDLPGCVAAADTIDGTEKLIAEAVPGEFQITLKSKGFERC